MLPEQLGVLPFFVPLMVDCSNAFSEMLQELAVGSVGENMSKPTAGYLFGHP